MKVLSRALRWSWLACIPGGALWALSPLGVHLSELKFKTPDVFWKLFPSAPLLLAVGLVGLYLFRDNRRDWLARLGFWAALGGIALIVAGAVGLFYLGVDDTYIMMAPAYRAFRIGLILFALGSMLLGVALAGEKATVWGTLPFAVGAVGALIAAARDLGAFGTTLWVLFGAAWAWLGITLLIGAVSRPWSNGTEKSGGSPPRSPR